MHTFFKNNKHLELAYFSMLMPSYVMISMSNIIDKMLWWTNNFKAY